MKTFFLLLLAAGLPAAPLYQAQPLLFGDSSQTTWANVINDHGVIGGYVYLGPNQVDQRAAVWTNGSAVTLPGSQTAVAALNSQGVAAVAQFVPTSTMLAWLWNGATLDALVANAAEVPGKVGENLRAGLETLELSRRLATIRCDLELPAAAANLEPAEPDHAKLRQIYTRFELRQLLRSLPGGDGGAAGPRPGTIWTRCHLRPTCSASKAAWT